MPQYNPTEQALLALLQQEQQRNSSTQPVEAPLPELDPSMFLSPAAQREMQAVQSFIPSTPTPPVSVPIQALRRELEAQPEESADIFSSDWDLTDEDFAPRQASQVEADPDIANLFMGRALQEIGTGDRALQRRAERLGEDLMDFEVEAPRMYEPPAERRAWGGTVVSQRGPGGFSPVPRAVPVQSPTRHVSATPQAPTGPTKSRYDRLLGPSVVD